MTLAEVFEDTQKIYSSHPVLISACEETRKNQLFIGEKEKLKCNLKRFPSECKIVVSQKRTFEAAEAYARRGEKVAVLNFANFYNAGGGVIYGARAQEECLCRISTLYDSLISPAMQEKFYNPHCKKQNDLANDDIIYSPGVLVFKSDSDEPLLRAQSEWFYTDVLTCAAPCLEKNFPSEYYDELRRLHLSRAKHILNAACKYRADVLILGAFGCGAFSNPPELVAEVYKKLLPYYIYAFKTIEFAVYCNQNDRKNFEAFKASLKCFCSV